eukprot:5087220-Amphidinium_carterae.1
MACHGFGFESASDDRSNELRDRPKQLRGSTPWQQPPSDGFGEQILYPHERLHRSASRAWHSIDERSHELRHLPKQLPGSAPQPLAGGLFDLSGRPLWSQS